MDTIKVAVRARPFSKREIELGGSKTQAIVINDRQIILNNNPAKDNTNRKSQPKSFTFDFCFD
jgi:hypothetical protein